MKWNFSPSDFEDIRPKRSVDGFYLNQADPAECARRANKILATWLIDAIPVTGHIAFPGWSFGDSARRSEHDTHSAVVIDLQELKR